MVREEYGFAAELRSPLKSGFSTFMAFLIVGVIPMLPFIFGATHSFAGACAMTGAAFFLVGSLKSRWTTEQFWISGIKTLSIGTAAAALAYTVGFILKEIVQ